MTAEPIAEGRIEAVLASTFGYRSFRPLQEEIVRTMLAGQDTFVLMPTGGGKSLCYQLPALLLPGVTVVVSPLIALMKDQVDALQALGVAATFINSSLDSYEVERRQAMVARREVKLLYVAPERLLMPGTLRLLLETPVDRFAIDEAHCISEWGHDFRPEYRELARLREIFPAVPIAALTATATSRVQADITRQLHLERAATFRRGFNRPNLRYEVRPKQDFYGRLVEYLRARPDASGIIYCMSRARTEDLAKRLRIDGFRAGAYHAGLGSEERRRTQEAFIRDDIRIITATVAFGMGIDKPDVRFVIHADLPKTLENYYQESGRAGRDGDPADCILFYSPADIMRIKRIVEEKQTPAERRTAQWQLERVIDWAESDTCRRRTLLAYFDEELEGQDGPCCDICRDAPGPEDVTIPAQMFLSCVMRTGRRFGAAHIVDVLRGSRNQRVLQLGHDHLSTYGIGRDRSDEEWRLLARELIRAGYLRQGDERFDPVDVTERGRRVLFEGERVALVLRRPPKEPAPITDETPYPDLFERLRELRKRLADERDVPPYLIFQNSVLRYLAAELPDTPGQLLQMPGIGEHKAREYGAAFLAAVAEYVAETGATPVAMPRSPARPQRTRGSLGDSVRFTVQLFQQGYDVGQIASERGLAGSTITGHLIQGLEAGEEIDLDRVIAPERRQAIQDAMAAVGGELLRPIMDHLGEGYTYDELRLVRAAVSRR